MSASSEIGQLERDSLNRFIDQLAREKATDVSVIQARFESRYFSSLIHFRLELDGSTHEFVAKFPKAERSRNFPVLPPRRPEDLELARLEYEALLRLARTWPVSDTAFVSPSFHDPVSGMIVLPRITGTDVFSKSLAAGLVMNKRPPQLIAIVEKVARALARYHETTVRVGRIDSGRLFTKMRQRAMQLGVELPPSISGVTFDDQGPVVPTIRGFEIRNMMTAGDRILLFDPGRLREEPAEADLARFVVSLRLLGWGTKFFLIPLDASHVEHAFLDTYRSTRSINNDWLRVLIVRELAWNWRESRQALETRAWPAWSRSLVSSLYVDRAFKRLWRQAS